MSDWKEHHNLAHRTVPHNLDAEESLLGAMLLSRDSIVMAQDADLRAEDFYKPAHARIYETIVALWERLEPVDPVSVADDLRRVNLLEQVGGPSFLLTLQAGTPATSNAGRYAKIIVEHAILRRGITLAGEVAEMAYSLPEDVAAYVDRVRELANNLELPLGSPTASPDILDFINTEFEFDWLVPGLLEQQDRLLITGPEGGGKSTLLRQCAVCLAAGMHPFRFNPIEPMRVLVIDLENTQRQNQRKYLPLVDKVRDRLQPGMLRIESRTEGLDLLTRSDHRWLLERIQACRPHVLITGPLYKLHAGDPNEEGPARTVGKIFDSIRARFGCALILEAHSPHGEGQHRPLRPIGASFWLRWPEFGYGMRRVLDDQGADTGNMLFLPWRGPRDEREWPLRLDRGGEGNWPWVDADYQHDLEYVGAGF